MERRHFLRGSILAASTLAVPGAVVAQRRAGGPPPRCVPAPCLPARAEWTGQGAPEGRVVADPSSLTDEERMHAPVLTFPERVRIGRAFDLVVQIGVRPHEVTPEHHIEWIEVCVGERRALVADLSTDVAYPVLRVPLVLRGPAAITVRARCNAHGVWMTRRDVAVG